MANHREGRRFPSAGKALQTLHLIPGREHLFYRAVLGGIELRACIRECRRLRLGHDLWRLVLAALHAREYVSLRADGLLRGELSTANVFL